jgi:glycolate oxidase iron-sulfur subunit
VARPARTTASSAAASSLKARHRHEMRISVVPSGMPEMIVSSNIGCQSHLAAGAQVRVTHWIVALDERLTG